VPSRPPSIYTLATVVEFNCYTTVGVSPDKFDAAAREAWINVTASAVESMSPESITILSVTNSTFNESLPAGNVRRRRLASEPSSDIVMAVSDTMESYGFSDADEFVNHVQTSIVDTYADPGTVVKFVKLAVAKGATRLTNTTTISISTVVFTPATTVRVFSGTPTTMPSAIPTSVVQARTAESTPLSTEETIYVTASVLFFGFIVLFVLWYRHHHGKGSKNEENVHSTLLVQPPADEKTNVQEVYDASRLFVPRGVRVETSPSPGPPLESKKLSAANASSPTSRFPQRRDSFRTLAVSKTTSETPRNTAVRGDPLIGNRNNNRTHDIEIINTKPPPPPPPLADPMNAWVKKFSDRRLRHYWVNTMTNESTWKTPLEVVNSSIHGDEKPLGETESRTSPILGLFSTDDSSKWEKKFSDRRLKFYWVNIDTKERTWKDPSARDRPQSTSGVNNAADMNSTLATMASTCDITNSVDHNGSTQKSSSAPPTLSLQATTKRASTVNTPEPRERNGELMTTETTARSTTDDKTTRGGWEKHFSLRKQQPYWKNLITNEMTWKDPQQTAITAPAPSSPLHATLVSNETGMQVEWVEKFSNKKLKSYWKNTKTSATTWNNPHESNASHTLDTDVPISFQQQQSLSIFEEEQGASGSVSGSIVGDKHSQSLNDEWVQKYSQRKEKPYWKHKMTKVTTWKCPHPSSSAKTHM